VATTAGAPSSRRGATICGFTPSIFSRLSIEIAATSTSKTERPLVFVTCADTLNVPCT
jgi:hypothetical protein